MNFLLRLKHFTLTLVAVLAALSIYLAVSHLTGRNMPTFITFYPIVLLAALIWGFWAGMFATVASIIVVDYFIFTPGTFKYSNVADLTAMVIFFFMGLMVCLVVERYRRLRDKLEIIVADRTSELTASNSKLSHEIDARQQSQQSLQQLNDELELRVAQQVAEIKKANENLEKRIVERTVELQSANISLRKSQQAALNLMEDAIQAGKKEQQANEKLARSQADLTKFNRILVALNKSNQSIAKIADEKQLLNEACRNIIENCGYSMVWIGFAQDDPEKSVLPVAFYGFDEGYIQKMKISWADTPRGQGPTGMAIRTGKPSICKDMLTDPKFAPWRQEAVKRGYASSIVLPLIEDSRTFGAISIYSKETDKFSDEEVSFLNELANDLAHGITIIR